MRFAENFRIPVKVEDLLKKLRENGMKHKVTYEVAMKEHKRQCIELLRKQADAIESGDLAKKSRYLKVSLPTPVSYMEAYAQIIEMLEMTTSKELEVTGSQFNAWVRDQWDWTDTYQMSTLSYHPG